MTKAPSTGARRLFVVGGRVRSKSLNFPRESLSSHLLHPSDFFEGGLLVPVAKRETPYGLIAPSGKISRWGESPHTDPVVIKLNDLSYCPLHSIVATFSGLCHGHTLLSTCKCTTLTQFCPVFIICQIELFRFRVKVLA